MVSRPWLPYFCVGSLNVKVNDLASTFLLKQQSQEPSQCYKGGEKYWSRKMHSNAMSEILLTVSFIPVIQLRVPMIKYAVTKVFCGQHHWGINLE